MAFGRIADRDAQIDALQDDKETLKGRVAELQGKLAAFTSVDVIADQVREELAAPSMEAEIEENAIAMARFSVVEAERQRMTEERAAVLKQQRFDEFAAEYRIEEGPKISERLVEQFKGDGTFEQIKEDAEKAVRIELHGDVLGEEKKRAEDELSAPAERERIIAELRTEIVESGEMQDFRTETRAKNEAAWTEQVKADVTAQIIAEEEAREGEFKATTTEDVRGSDGTAKFRKKKRAELEKAWTDKTIEEVSAAINDEELTALLVQRAEQAKADLRKQTEAHKLLDAFTRDGLNVEQLPTGTKLEIFLGEVKDFSFDVPYKDNYGNKKTKVEMRPGISCSRKLTLGSLGGGKFVVDGDSLLEANSSYERDNALHRGTVIVPGRCIKDGKQQRLDGRLVADVPLYYDDDKEDPNIHDCYDPIANIIVDGVSARNIQYIEGLDK